jgi:hypothetical protein
MTIAVRTVTFAAWSIAATLLIPHAMRAQAADSSKSRIVVGAAQTSAGYLSLGLAGLNSTLTDAGLPAMVGGSATVGFSADMRFGRFLVSGGLQSIVPGMTSSATHRTRVSGSMASLDGGVFVARGKTGALFLLAGLGARALDMRVEQRGDVGFDDILSNPGRGMAITGTTLLTHVGAGAEWRPLARREVSVSVRAGMLRGMKPQDWSGEFDDVTGGPDNVRGSYVSVGVSTPLRNRRGAVLPMAASLLRLVRS